MLCPLLSCESGAASTRGLCNLATAGEEMICGWHMVRGMGLQMDERALFTSASPPQPKEHRLGHKQRTTWGITHVLRPLRTHTCTQQPLQLTSSLMATHTHNTQTLHWKPSPSARLGERREKQPRVLAVLNYRSLQLAR